MKRWQVRDILLSNLYCFLHRNWFSKCLQMKLRATPTPIRPKPDASTPPSFRSNFLNSVFIMFPYSRIDHLSSLNEGSRGLGGGGGGRGGGFIEERSLIVWPFTKSIEWSSYTSCMSPTIVYLWCSFWLILTTVPTGCYNYSKEMTRLMAKLSKMIKLAIQPPKMLKVKVYQNTDSLDWSPYISL